MTTVFQLGLVNVFNDFVFGWCIQIVGDEPTICVFNCNNPVLLREVVRVFRDSPTMSRTMGDFFEVAEKRIRDLELEEATKKMIADVAQLRKEIIELREEAIKKRLLVKRMESRSALFELIQLPGKWLTAPFTGHHSEDSLGEFVKTLRIENGVLFTLSSDEPDMEYRVAWIDMNTLMAGVHIDEDEMTQFSDATKGDAIYAWCKRTMERFW
jgi:hypothetical protein